VTDTRTPILQKMGELQHALDRVRLRHINERPADEQQASFNLFVIRSIELARLMGYHMPVSIKITGEQLFPMIQMCNRNEHADLLLEQSIDGTMSVTQRARPDAPPNPAIPKEIQG